MANRGKGWRRYEFGRATVFIKKSGVGFPDGLILLTFHAEVHPVGGPVVLEDVMAFYPWDAANRALSAWEESNREDQA